MRLSVGRGREVDERKIWCERVKPSKRRLLAQQTVVGAVLGCGKKVVAMWQLPQLFRCVVLARGDVLNQCSCSRQSVLVLMLSVNARAPVSQCQALDLILLFCILLCPQR